MSGHSKWANIKNRKGAQDKKRSEAFTKMAKNILTAIRENGGNTNPENNNSLRTAIDRAKLASMPKENIERLLKNFEAKKDNLVSFWLEGYASVGVPLMIEVETDNKNRTLGEVKLILKNHGVSLGESGSVAYLFDRKGEIELGNKLTDDQQLEIIDLGVEDIEENYLYVRVEDMENISQLLESKNLEVVSKSIVMRSKSPIIIDNEDQVEKVVDLVEDLEDNEDVVSVFAGFTYNA